MNATKLKVRENLREAALRVMKHPLLAAIGQGTLSAKAALHVFTQYGHYCEYFPRFLASAAAKVPHEEWREPIVRNLWEEHGEGNPARSHRVLYRRFLDSLAARTDSTSCLRTPGPAVSRYLARLDEFFRDASPLEAIGAIGPGTEDVTPAQYAAILAGLATQPWAAGCDLEFFTVHVSADTAHADSFWEILHASIADEVSLAAVTRGARFALEREREFWDSLAEEIRASSAGACIHAV